MKEEIYQKGESVRVVYEVDPDRKEIGIFSRIESEHYVLTSLEDPKMEIFVSRHHAKIEKLTGKERKQLEELASP